MHGVFILCPGEEVECLHPEGLAKGLSRFLGIPALRAGGEGVIGFRLQVSAKDELIDMAAAEGAGFAVSFPMNESDRSRLFLHRFLLHEVVSRRRAVRVIVPHGRVFEHTVEVGGVELKRGVRGKSPLAHHV